MISDNCPRLRVVTQNGFQWDFEAFAFTYLSQYNTEAVPQRAFLSYQRAFGCTRIDMHQRVPGGRPGYLVAFYDGPGVNKVFVSIEGSTSIPQLWSSANGALSAAPIAGLPGFVWGVPKAYSETIYNELLASDVFLAAATRPNTAVICTGWSLGAAIAEILAMRFKLWRPSKWVECWKYGSPRVGDSAWRAGTMRLNNYFSTILERDCVCMFPADNAYRSGEPGIFGLWPGIQCYVYDRNLVIREPNGDNAPQVILQPPSAGTIALVRAYFAARTPENAWYHHDLNQYRSMFMELAEHFGGMGQYRFKYLETPLESSWSTDWSSGAGVPANLRLLDPPPPDRPPTFAGLAEQLRDAQPQVLIEQDQFGDSEGGAWGGGDFGGAVVDDIARGAGLPVGLQPVLPSITHTRPRRTRR